MPDLDAAYTVALQMVQDEMVFQRMPPGLARDGRQMATGHAAGVAALAAREGTGESRATIVEGADGSVAVVVVTMIRPR